MLHFAIKGFLYFVSAAQFFAVAIIAVAAASIVFPSLYALLWAMGIGLPWLLYLGILSTKILPNICIIAGMILLYLSSDAKHAAKTRKR